LPTSHYLNPFNVFASRALCPNLPPFLAASFNFLAGIFSPFFTPHSFLKDPGFFIAFCIQSLAIIFYP